MSWCAAAMSRPTCWPCTASEAVVEPVASSREVEKYRREREDAIKPKIAVTAKQAKSFNTFVPDFDQLASFERKVEKKADQLDARQNGLAVEETVNVMGSTAGAGSGDFHMYRGHRAVELQRLADFEGVGFFGPRPVALLSRTPEFAHGRRKPAADGLDHRIGAIEKPQLALKHLRDAEGEQRLLGVVGKARQDSESLGVRLVDP